MIENFRSKLRKKLANRQNNVAQVK